MKNRSYARELAMKELYQLDLMNDETPTREDLERRLSERAKQPRVVDFASDLILGTRENREWIDNTIQSFLENWTLTRTPVIDRNILRLATYEIFFRSDIPPKVSINEAVEVAKKYGSNKSGAFVNGVLDKIKKNKDELTNLA